MSITPSLSDLVLLSLEKSVEGYLKFIDFTYHPLRYFSGYSKNINKNTILKTIRRLKQRGLIEFTGEEELLLKLTDSGKNKAVWISLINSKKIWDGKWRIVIFDIPEKRRSARDLLRSKLKQWGFTPWQKSVWVSKKDCTKPIRDFIKQIGIQDWVMVIESNNVGI